MSRNRWLQDMEKAGALRKVEKNEVAPPKGKIVRGKINESVEELKSRQRSLRNLKGNYPQRRWGTQNTKTKKDRGPKI